MTANRISATLSQEDLDAILSAVKTIEGKMPFLIDLSTEDRVNMLKLGDKSRAFVEKTLEVVTQNPNFLPRSFDEQEMIRDIELYRSLYRVAIALRQLNDLVEDTLMVCGSEAYAAALTAYRYAKDANLGTGLDSVIDDLARRFSRKSSKPAE